MRAFRLVAIAVCGALCLALVGSAGAQAPARRIPFGSQSGLPRDLCYAFQQGPGFAVTSPYKLQSSGPIWVSCRGVTQRVSLSSSVWTFAVSPEQLVLAAMATRDGPVRLYSLRPPYGRLPWRGPTGADLNAILPSCGTIVAWLPRLPGMVNGLTGGRIRTGSFVETVCDESQTVFAGVPRGPAPERLDLSVPLPQPPARLGPIAAAARRAIARSPEIFGSVAPYFAISPNGAYVAWGSGSGGGWPIWISPTSNLMSIYWTHTCQLGWHADGTEGASFDSVGDDGSIVFTSGSQANPCPWCGAVYYWRPGMKLPILLHKYAAGAQFITPAAARGLIARYKYLLAHRRKGTASPARPVGWKGR